MFKVSARNRLSRHENRFETAKKVFFILKEGWFEGAEFIPA